MPSFLSFVEELDQKDGFLFHDIHPEVEVVVADVVFSPWLVHLQEQENVSSQK